MWHIVNLVVALAASLTVWSSIVVNPAESTAHATYATLAVINFAVVWATVTDACIVTDTFLLTVWKVGV